MTSQIIVSSIQHTQLYNSSGSTQKPSKKVIAKDRASAKSVLNVLHPIFMEAAQVTDDAFWKEILVSLGTTGSYKKITVFRKSTEQDVHGTLYYKQKTKDIPCPIEGGPAQVFNDVRDFLIKNANIISSRDKEERHAEMTELSKQKQIDSWNAVKSQHQRKDMVEVYASSQNVSPNLKSQLMEIILCGLNCKLIDASDISVENGKIDRINGINFNGTRYSISPEMFNKIRSK